jgi:oxygen-independent coproporphyrinogen-3 oxidase
MSSERQPERWLAAVEAQGHANVEASLLTPDEQADEALLMGLRLSEGIDLDRLRELAGVGPSEKVVERLIARGLLERTARRLRATPAGRPVLNALVVELAGSLRRGFSC